jgi:ubiquinone/menaquinone biosynthesis C-methylase UbiE
MPTIYNARDAGNYERLMGRWSRRLAPLFIEHAGVADGEEVLEIGCGTGSLTFALAEAAGFARLTAIDQSAVYLAAAQAKNWDPRIRLEQGDGCALRFADASFDRTLSMLVLPSVLPEPEQMVGEMCRVTRPGGVVAAAFINACSGTPPRLSTSPPGRHATALCRGPFMPRARCSECGPRPGSSRSTSDR